MTNYINTDLTAETIVAARAESARGQWSHYDDAIHNAAAMAADVGCNVFESPCADTRAWDAAMDLMAAAVTDADIQAGLQAIQAAAAEWAA